MADFKQAARMVLNYEGGYRQDMDGKTNYGINERYHDVNIEGLTEDEAVGIYFKDYWMPLKLERINNNRIAARMLDMVINHGGDQRTVMMFQEAVNDFLHVYDREPIKEDGIVGPKTIEAINSIKERHINAFLKLLSAIRIYYYRHLIHSNDAKKVEFIGWLNRA